MPQLVDNTELQALSKNFIMVNGHDGQDARAMEYVDAKYNPRFENHFLYIYYTVTTPVIY